MMVISLMEMDVPKIASSKMDGFVKIMQMIKASAVLLPVEMEGWREMKSVMMETTLMEMVVIHNVILNLVTGATFLV